MIPPANPVCDKKHRFPAKIISHGVWLYYRFSLSYRDVQDLPCGTRPARRRHWPTQRRRGVKTMRRIAAGVFQGGCAPAGPALK
jgi:hypothetical protein